MYLAPAAKELPANRSTSRRTCSTLAPGFPHTVARMHCTMPLERTTFFNRRRACFFYGFFNMRATAGTLAAAGTRTAHVEAGELGGARGRGVWPVGWGGCSSRRTLVYRDRRGHQRAFCGPPAANGASARVLAKHCLYGVLRLSLQGMPPTRFVSATGRAASLNELRDQVCLLG